MLIRTENAATNLRSVFAIIGAIDGHKIVVGNEERNTNLMICMKLQEYLNMLSVVGKERL